jgi:tetratricopeptide (TPR) repeat protein
MKPTSTILLLLFLNLCMAQEMNSKLFLRKMKDRSEKQVWHMNEVRLAFTSLDNSMRNSVIEELKANAGKNPYVITRLYLLEIQVARDGMSVRSINDLKPIIDLYEKAIKKAIETGDELLIADCCRDYGRFCVEFNLLDKAMFYLAKSMELQEKNGLEKFQDPGIFKIEVGNVLYKVQEYELCIRYTKEGIHDLGNSFYYGVYNVYNTVGLAYQKLGQYDSAITWYRKAIPLAEQAKDTAWKGILIGNIGDTYFQRKQYDSAKLFLLGEFELNRKGELYSGYNSLQWVARILALQGKADSALLVLRQSETVLPPGNFQDKRTYYETKAEVFRALNMTDSAFHYFRLYQHDNDSIRDVLARGKMDIIQVRLEYERSHNQVEEMVKEKKLEKTKRNLLAAGIVLVAIAGFLIYRMQRNRNMMQQRLLTQEKQAAIAQLGQFTTNIVEKNEMIEKLQDQINQRNTQLTHELLEHAILTDEDWFRFRQLFEKARPGFFEKLQHTVPGITTAELRLAALISLNLDTRHIAAMQGTSADTVRKSKSRLRQRLNISLEDGLEEFIRAI